MDQVVTDPRFCLYWNVYRIYDKYGDCTSESKKWARDNGFSVNGDCRACQGGNTLYSWKYKNKWVDFCGPPGLDPGELNAYVTDRMESHNCNGNQEKEICVFLTNSDQGLENQAVQVVDKGELPEPPEQPQQFGDPPHRPQPAMPEFPSIGGIIGGPDVPQDMDTGTNNEPNTKPTGGECIKRKYTCEEKCAYGRYMAEKCKGCRPAYRRRRKCYYNYRRRSYYKRPYRRYYGTSKKTTCSCRK